ncbi:MAG: SDR family oxidoreductase [Caldilineaceae bacterium]|nr:SDR family oxidoreductase [Caldilineaceae bacterium]
MKIAGKTALVTGGAHRVGKAISMMLAQNGANVVINYYSSDAAARQTVEEATSLGVDAMAIQCDVSVLADVQQMKRQVEDRFGGVDILVNSADLFGKHPFPTDDYTIWQRVTSVTIDGAFYVSNEFAPLMLARRAGVIVNIVDLSAWYPWPNFMAHSVAKAGLLAMTNQMALELAPHVRVNAVAPGPVLPPPDYDGAMLDRVARRTLLDRWGSAEDVAFAVKYLIEADYVTADVIRVDGGEFYGHRKG